ncbi:MAG: hypothetical protein WDN00_09355 [Limisphaerales bacterium]
MNCKPMPIIISEITNILKDMTPILTALLIALVNGFFLFYAKRKFDRDIQVLQNDLSTLRDLTVRHFDRRADVYYAAIEPFIQLFVLTGSQSKLTIEEIKEFHKTALTLSARVQLFGSETVHGRYCEMYDWTKTMLDQSATSIPPNSSAKALELARIFLMAARDDLFLKPNSRTTNK